MPRKSNSTVSSINKTNRTSQATSSQKSQRNVSEMSEVDEANKKIEKLSNALIRYVILRGEDMPLRRKDMVKCVTQSNGNSRNFDKILAKAEKILLEVYGYKLHICEQIASDRVYALTNALPYKDLEIRENISIPEDSQKILIMLVLAHIFMSNNEVTDVSLNSYLLNMNIDINKTHKIFGKVDSFINQTMIKMKYIDVHVDQINKKTVYSWGSRAEATVSKENLLKFISSIYKNQPNAWINQYKAAEEQSKEFQIGEPVNEDVEIVEV